MNNKEYCFTGTDFYVKQFGQGLFELGLKNASNVKFIVDSNGLKSIVDQVKCLYFDVDTDYCIDPKNVIPFYLTRWSESDGFHYCIRAWVGGSWFGNNHLTLNDITGIASSLESALLDCPEQKKLVYPNLTPLPVNPEKREQLTNAKISELRNEMVKRLDDLKKKK